MAQDARLKIKKFDFDTRSSCYQLVTISVGDYPRTGKPHLYITSTKINSVFRTSEISKLSTSLLGCD